MHSPSPDGCIAHIQSHVFEPLECVCGNCFAWFRTYAHKGRTFHRRARLHAKTPNLSTLIPPTCPRHVFGYQDHIQSVGFSLFAWPVCWPVCWPVLACVGLCVGLCIEDLAILQHAAHSGLNSHDGRVVHTLPHVFDPQKCVCGIYFGQF